ncbi:MAG TPA: AtpZ/AtpI family protein [Bryobacteraceae bacterium]|nr:AtpZ/AtpI family protein [Bryobacteraceae bacterium]
MPERDDNPLVAVGRYSGLALVLPVATMIGYVIGYGLDKLFGTNFLDVIFLIVGIIAGFVSLFRQLNREMKRDGS